MVSPGYTFPDPALLVGATTPDKRLRYLATWLVTRSAWQRTVLQNIAAPPKANNQLWRDYLLSAAGLPSPPASSTPSALTSLSSSPSPSSSSSSVQYPRSPLPAACSEPDLRLKGRKLKQHDKTKAAQAKDTVHSMIHLEPTEVDPDVLYFKTLAIQRGQLGDVAPTITTAVLWELCENNFRFDLLALDRLAAPHLWGDEMGSVMRDAQLREVFPGSGYYCVGPNELPTVNEGLAANDVGERIIFVGRLRAIEQSWPQPPPQVGFPLRKWHCRSPA